MPLSQPDVKLVATKIGRIPLQLRIAMVQDFSADDPSHVRPPAAIPRAVRIAFTVAGLMMNTMRAYPEDRSTLKSECGASSEKIFNPFRNFVSAMRQQAVIAHSDSEAQGEVPQNGRYQQRFPTKHEQRCDRANVKDRHHKGGIPVDLAPLRRVNLRNCWLRKSVRCNDRAHSLRLPRGQHLST